MTLGTLFRYLIGDREAIHEIITTRAAVWIGLVFVLSAGLAREYDGEDLLAAPWHLAIPLAASLVTSFLLYTLLWLVAVASGAREFHFLGGYRRFLSLYWLTAPLAWLYAIPVERFLSAEDATAANLALLGLVSLWRVALIVRAASVLYKVRHTSVIPVVMLFADTVALVLLYVTPLPVISIMGGVRLSESEALLQGTAIWVGFLGVVSWPIWLIGTLLVVFRGRFSWSLLLPPFADASRVSGPLKALAAGSLLVWAAILPLTQPEQQLRREVEAHLAAGEIREAVALLSKHTPDDLPPHYDPPPHLAYDEIDPPPVDLIETALAEKSPDWVCTLFARKYQDYLGDRFRGGWLWSQMSEEEFDRNVAIVAQLPDVLEDQKPYLREQLKLDSPRSETQKARLRELIGDPLLRPEDPQEAAVEPLEEYWLREKPEEEEFP